MDTHWALIPRYGHGMNIYPMGRVCVRFDPSFDRIPHPDASLEESIGEVIWNQRLQQNPSLYNGTKFRDICWNKSQSTVGEIFGPLSRSNNVGESPGHYVFPGGHSEPQEVGILAHQNDEKDVAGLTERISDEMFDGIIREVVEETGVPASSLTEPILIGVSRRETNVRPAAFFYMRCNIDSSAITELYARAQDGYESTKIYAVSVNSHGVLRPLNNLVLLLDAKQYHSLFRR
uniref:Nudix hydrolase domain-containing protein n=1 Tax=Aegilops tauschii TaxID=37682 RepID=N1QPV5_AEGTA